MTYTQDSTLLNAELRACRAETRANAKSFYFASHVLPKDKRDAAYAVYAFCRLADNTVDEAAPGDTTVSITARLDGLRALVDGMYTGSGLPPSRFKALALAVQRYQIPKRHFHELLDGVQMDLTQSRFESFAELENYCYHVASVVGLIMTHVFGGTDAQTLRHAAALGTAMQLTNILRDIGEDLTLGRIYIPQNELRLFGVSEEDLHAGKVTPAFRTLMAFQIDRARGLYRSARLGILALPDDGSRYCTRLMADIYEGILDEIVRNEYDVFTRRAHVPTRKKFAIAFASYFRRADQQRGVPPPKTDYTLDAREEAELSETENSAASRVEYKRIPAVALVEVSAADSNASRQVEYKLIPAMAGSESEQ